MRRWCLCYKTYNNIFIKGRKYEYQSFTDSIWQKTVYDVSGENSEYRTFDKYIFDRFLKDIEESRNLKIEEILNNE